MIIKIVLVAAFIAIANAGLLGGSYGGIGSGGIGIGGFGNAGLGGGIGIEGGLGGTGGYGGNRGYGGYGYAGPVADVYAPPHYEYKYVVGDPHTYDAKEQVESRVEDLTKSAYSTGQADRITQVSRVIQGTGAVRRGGY